MEIYDRAKQRGSDDYLTVNQPSDPVRVSTIIAKSDERRERRARVRVLKPRRKGIAPRPTAKPTQYAKLPSGQIVGYPRPMVEVKQDARRSRLRRRKNFRIEKRFAAITQAAL
jgi:hypothetical protein